MRVDIFLHKIIVSSVKKVKKEVKSFLLKPKGSMGGKSNSMKAKDNISLFNRGKNFVKDVLLFKTKNTKLTSRTTSKKYFEKNSKLFTQNNLRGMFAYIFSDFSMDQIEDMLKYFFGDLSFLERENLLFDILDHITNKEYGFLLK
jgi:hypothetical protein